MPQGLPVSNVVNVDVWSGAPKAIRLRRYHDP